MDVFRRFIWCKLQRCCCCDRTRLENTHRCRTCEKIHTFGIFLLFWVAQKRRPFLRLQDIPLSSSIPSSGWSFASWLGAMPMKTGRMLIEHFPVRKMYYWDYSSYSLIYLICCGMLIQWFVWLCGFIILVNRTLALVGFFKRQATSDAAIDQKLSPKNCWVFAVSELLSLGLELKNASENWQKKWLITHVKHSFHTAIDLKNNPWKTILSFEVTFFRLLRCIPCSRVSWYPVYPLTLKTTPSRVFVGVLKQLISWQ